MDLRFVVTNSCKWLTGCEFHDPFSHYKHLIYTKYFYRNKNKHQFLDVSEVPKYTSSALCYPFLSVVTFCEVQTTSLRPCY